ncbi:MAG: DUF4625 domain-containing protein [Flavobacterium sp.]|nr:DUF4625 domain-containing protein [Candidatus Neoflavobacterium equi]
MKMTKMILIASLALGLTNCSSDANLDTEKPVITLLEPEDHESFKPGSEIHLEGLITDNVELSNYKVEIHSAEDGHSHAKTSQENFFQYEETFQIPANQRLHEFHHHIDIPLVGSNALPFTEGHYHLGIFALDKAGNQAQIFVEIYIGEDAEEHHHG